MITVIEELEAEIASLRDQLAKTEAERDDVLRALKPFADAEEHLGDRMPDSSSCVMFHAVGIDVGDFRRARTVMNGTYILDSLNRQR